MTKPIASPLPPLSTPDKAAPKMPVALRPITTQDLWALRRFGAASLSPDGAWACVPVTQFDMAGNDSSTQLWLLSTDGKQQRQLTQGHKDSDPQWSPDGKSLAFLSKRGTGKDADASAQLYVMPADGGEAHRVMSLATGVSCPRWFADGVHMAFVSWVWPELATPAEQARRYKEDQADKVRATVIEHNHYRYWDHWFARGRVPHIHTVKIGTGKDAGQVTDLFAGTGLQLPPQDPDAHLFDISPDGRELVFTHDFDKDPQAYWLTDLVALGLTAQGRRSGAGKRLTHATGRRGGCASDSPRYSPDGRWIAFLSSDCKTQHNAQNQVWLIERGSGKVRGLTTSWDRGVNAPLQWTSDSASVCFTAEDGIAQPLWQMPLTADEPTQLMRGAAHGGVATDLRVSLRATLRASPDARPTGKPAVPSDASDTLVYARSSHAHPPEIFALQLPRVKPDQHRDKLHRDDVKERHIERFNTRLVRQLQMGAVQSHSIVGQGGDAVQMWSVLPPGTRTRAHGAPKARLPLMHVIHGGPHTCSNDAWHWRWNTQLLAAAGYLVAAVNYHGSTGWGQKFISSIDGDWGQRELVDIEAGTDHLLSQGWADPKRMVATGGSYGGYMVATMNGRVKSDRYRAYVCHAGCYDWVAMMATDGYLWFGRELGAFHWEDEARVLKQSPHHYAAHFKTPTLVLHGEQDFRVPVQQGLAYYNTLRARQIPSRLVYFPDENHWILKPQNSRLWYQEFIAWCDRYTPGKNTKAGAKTAPGQRPN